MIDGGAGYSVHLPAEDVLFSIKKVNVGDSNYCYFLKSQTRFFCFFLFNLKNWAVTLTNSVFKYLLCKISSSNPWY